LGADTSAALAPDTVDTLDYRITPRVRSNEPGVTMRASGTKVVQAGGYER